MSEKMSMCQKLRVKSELLGQRITSWADLASCVCVRQWRTPVRTGMVAAPSCVIQKVTWFTAAADLVLHWLGMATTVKVKNHTCLCRSTLKEKENSFRFFRVNYNCRKPQNLSASLWSTAAIEAEVGNYSQSDWAKEEAREILDLIKPSCWTKCFCRTQWDF